MVRGVKEDSDVVVSEIGLEIKIIVRQVPLDIKNIIRRVLRRSEKSNG